jgi:hypothetical protein
MNKAIVTTAASLILAASLAACGGAPQGNGPATQDPVEPVTKTSEAPTPPAEPKSERGNTIKKIGEPAHWKADTNDPNSATLGSFTVRKIAPVTCTGQFAQKPENGHLIALTIDVTTTKELANETPKEVYLSPMSFEYVAPNGTNFNGNLSTGATYGCIDDSQVLKSSFGPSAKAHGLMILDVPQKGGVLTIGNVEWQLPK